MKIVHIPNFIFKMLERDQRDLSILADPNGLANILSEEDVVKYRLFNWILTYHSVSPFSAHCDCVLELDLNEKMVVKTHTLFNEQGLLDKEKIAKFFEIEGYGEMELYLQPVHLGKDVIGVVFTNDVKYNNPSDFYVALFDLLAPLMGSIEVTKTQMYVRYIEALRLENACS